MLEFLTLVILFAAVGWCVGWAAGVIVHILRRRK